MTGKAPQAPRRESAGTRPGPAAWGVWALLAVAHVVLAGCSPSRSEGLTTDHRPAVAPKNPVEVMVLEKGFFARQLVSNGKLRALRQSDLRFRVGGQVSDIRVRNGQPVRLNEPLARLDPFEYAQKLEFAQTTLSTATLELEDILLGRRFSLKDSLRVPPEIYKMATIRSGYTNASRDVKIARYNLEATELRAPFAGKIANLAAGRFERADPSVAFCTLIDDSEFEVEFSLTETEIQQIGAGEKISLSPFSFPATYAGAISQINPVVDENGLVLVKARVKNRDGRLMEGMNVKVLVQKKIPGQLVVPRAAVVQRQNQEVVFKYSRGKAHWAYVQIHFENDDSYAVAALPGKGGSLAPGDTIITGGNVTLAHESEVVLSGPAGY